MTFLLLLLTFLAVPPAPGFPIHGPAFQLAVSPARPILEQGGGTAITVDIQSSSPADFRLRFEGVPATVMANNSILRPGVNTIVFSCSPAARPGVYALEITAMAGENQQTQTIPFVIRPKGSSEPR
jgi:hypothetical protein